jgi:Domain of unknown function (DUF3395)
MGDIVTAQHTTTSNNSANDDTGHLLHSSDTITAAAVPRNIDVTTALQFFVHNSTLQLPASSKAGLLGFYDVAGVAVCCGAETSQQQQQQDKPELYIRYAYAGKLLLTDYACTFKSVEARAC